MNLDETLEREILERIENNECAMGEWLPSERALSFNAGVSRGVAREALRRVARRGCAAASARAGYRMLPKKMVVRLNANGSLASEALSGLSWRTERDALRFSGSNAATWERIGFRNDVAVAKDIWQFEGNKAAWFRDACAMGEDIRAIAGPIHETCTVDLDYDLCPWSDDIVAQPMLRHRSEGRNYEGVRLFVRTILLRPREVRLEWKRGGCG